VPCRRAPQSAVRGQRQCLPDSRASKIRPERIEYYLEKREPEFETKMATVLHVYKQVEVLREVGPEQGGELVAVLFYDEKPGI